MKIVLVWYQHDWGLYGRRYEMIARTWARLHPSDEILVVEPPLNPWTWLKHTLAALLPLDRGQSRFWLSRLKHVSAAPTRVSHNLWHVQPFLLWPFSNRGRNAWTNYCYAKAWTIVEAFVREQQWDEPLLWVYPPHAFVHYAAMTWKGTRICVDLVDDNAQVSSMPEALRESYRRVYRDVLSRAEVVFAVSDDLLQRYDVSPERGICVPNGLSYGSNIATGWKNSHVPAGPRACYVGRIDDRLDLDLISRLANENSDVQFIFIGPIEPHFRKQWNAAMGHRANVHTWGTVSHLDMGAVLSEMDVCLLPHRDNSLTRSMDPLKLYVYLSYGKPVVATMARIAPDLEAFVRRAQTADEFSAALRVALKNRNTTAPDLSEHLWEKRVRQMEEALAVKKRSVGVGREPVYVELKKKP